MSRGLCRAQEQLLHVVTSRSVRTRIPAGPSRERRRNKIGAMGEWLRRAYSSRPHKICPRQAMPRPRERARPLIPITIEHADCLHRFSTASPVDKLAGDRRRPPCIRKVQTVALAVVPEKASNGACSRTAAVAKVRAGCSSERRSSGGTWRTAFRRSDSCRLVARNSPQTWRAPRRTVTIDLECKKGINRDTPGLDARHKIISHGQDHRGGSETRQGDRVLKCRVNAVSSRRERRLRHQFTLSRMVFALIN
jgi:hypothetical protein